MRDFVADLGENRKFFLGTHLSEDRYNWHNLAAIVTCLEMAGGPTDAKAPNLSNMYENNQNFDNNEPTARKVKRHLNYMRRVLKGKPPQMNIKWGFVDLYLLISEMDRSYVIRNREADFASFYVAFETERRSISDPDKLITQNKSDWNKNLHDYIQAFKSQGGTRKNIEERHKVYIKRFLRHTQNLMPKDPQRLFTHDERIVLWQKS